MKFHLKFASNSEKSTDAQMHWESGLSFSFDTDGYIISELEKLRPCAHVLAEKMIMKEKSPMFERLSIQNFGRQL